MLNKLRERMGREEGFTLVELLVVMLILGILAAIAIPSFFSQRDKARDANAKSAVRTAQTAIETYATDNNSDYTGASLDTTDPIAPGSLQGIEPTLLDVGDRLTFVGTPDEDGYTVQVESENEGQLFRITRAADGTTTLTCDVAGEGGCPTGGEWD